MNKRKIKEAQRSVKYKSRSFLFTIYSKIKHPFWVWKLLNLKNIRLFTKNKPTLTDLQKNIVADLKKEGVAITSLSELYCDGVLQELLAYVEKKEDRKSINHKKPFLIDYLPEIPELGFENPFFKVAASKEVLNVVNTYMGMYSSLYHFMVRETLLSEEEPILSQKWHRAPQEQKTCKVYIYLNDVDEDSGPFMYIPQSTSNKKWGVVFPQGVPRGGFIDIKEIDRVIPKEEQITITGKAGTVIFCDTTGLHRGGYSTNKSRIMSTFGYGAPTHRENICYSFPKGLSTELDKLPGYTPYLLNNKWMRKSH